MRIYKLKLDTSRAGDPAYDAVILPSQDSNNYRHYFLNPNLYPQEKLPAQILFLANFHYLPELDFIFNDAGLVTISKRVLDLLSGLSDVKITAVPVVLIDDTFQGEKFDKEGSLRTDVPINDRYFAIRLEKLDSYFDFELSEFKPQRSNPQYPALIRKLVLQRPAGGFPPVFRTKEKVSDLFVTSLIREALEKINVKGCFFEDVQVNDN